MAEAEPSRAERSRAQPSPSMRLPSMSQPFLLAPIAECAPGPPGGEVRLAVLGARGVGKSGECSLRGCSAPGCPLLSLPCPPLSPFVPPSVLTSPSLPALIVRFLTKRFIGDYEPNTGSLYSRLVRLDGEHVAVQIQDTPGCLQVRPRRPPPQNPGNRRGGKKISAARSGAAPNPGGSGWLNGRRVSL